MDEQAFRQFLKEGGRSPNAIDRCVSLTQAFEAYLDKRGQTLDAASDDDLHAYVEYIERRQTSAKTQLWAIRYYYQYTENLPMALFAGALREIRIQRRPFALADFKDVKATHVKRLAKIKIKHIEAMLEAGGTPEDRLALAKKTKIPLADIETLVKLSDIARIPGTKGVRARLYIEVGVDTLEKLANSDAEELRQQCIDYIETTGFDGIPPWPAEVAYSIAKAQTLSKQVYWDSDE